MASIFSDFLLIACICVFLLGVLSFVAGVIILLKRTLGKDIRTLATQTNRLAQKGIVDGVAGLVGNVSTLMEATNQLTRTAQGIGAFLIFVGLFLMAGSIILFLNI